MPWYKRWRTLVPFLALLITSPSYSQSGGSAQTSNLLRRSRKRRSRHQTMCSVRLRAW